MNRITGTMISCACVTGINPYTYNASAADGADLVEFKRLTDTHIAIERQKHGQPRVSRTEPVSGRIHPTKAVRVDSTDRRRPDRLEYIGQK